MAGIKDALKQAVRSLAFKTSVESLRKQGVDKVSVLGLDRIVALIDEAVHRSLKSRMIGVERDAVVDATKSEFLRLLRTNEELRREKTEVEHLREQAQEEVDQLRREIAKEQRALEQRMQEQAAIDAARNYGENEDLAKRVREIFGAMAQHGEVMPAGLQERVIEVVIDTVGEERKAAEIARQALRDREVETLQRRIQKLNQSLETTEQRLKQVAAMKSVDEGIASIYRNVQGLDSGEGQVERKKELMANIFAANMQIQKKQA